MKTFKDKKKQGKGLMLDIEQGTENWFSYGLSHSVSQKWSSHMSLTGLSLRFYQGEGQSESTKSQAGSIVYHPANSWEQTFQGRYFWAWTSGIWHLRKISLSNIVTNSSANMRIGVSWNLKKITWFQGQQLHDSDSLLIAYQRETKYNKIGSSKSTKSRRND
jgi:hypothetical protein